MRTDLEMLLRGLLDGIKGARLSLRRNTLPDVFDRAMREVEQKFGRRWRALGDPLFGYDEKPRGVENAGNG